MRERLAFLHLPKAAGSSYRHAFAQHYAPDVTVPWLFDRVIFGHHHSIETLAMPILLDADADLSGYRYMVGHFALPTITRSFDAADVVSILREPRARLLSHYTFWRSWSAAAHEEWVSYNVSSLATSSLVDFCTHGAAAHQTDNLITRMIVGDHPLIPVDGLIAAADRDELTRLGLEQIDRLGFVDVLERGDATFAALEQWFGSPLEAVRLNETDLDKGPPLQVDEVTDPRVHSLLEDRTVIDQVLWRHVAMRAGLSADEAQALGDRTAAASLASMVERAKQHAAHPIPPEHTDNAVGGGAGGGRNAPEEEPRLPASERLVALIRRGPKAIVERLRAEIVHRRQQRDAR